MKESFVHRLVGFSIRYSWIVILVAALLTVFLGYFALQIRIDADVFNMLPRHYKVLELAEKYGSSKDTAQLLIAVESEDLFDLEKLQTF